MQWRSLRGTVEGAPHRLAVDRHNPLAAFGKPLHEADEPGVEARRIKQPKDAAECVVAWYPVRECQKLLQKLTLRAAKQRHIRTGLPAAQHRAERNHKNLVQQMAFGVAGTRVLKFLENFLAVLHGASPPIGAIRRILNPSFAIDFFKWIPLAQNRIGVEFRS